MRWNIRTSLAAKLAGFAMVLVALSSAGVALFATELMSREASETLERRGRELAASLEVRDVLAVHRADGPQLSRRLRHLGAQGEITWARILDARGAVLASEIFLPGLSLLPTPLQEGPERLRMATALHVQDALGGESLDLLIPLESPAQLLAELPAGAHVPVAIGHLELGLDRRWVDSRVAAIREQTFAFGALFAGLLLALSWLAAHAVARSVQPLAALSRDVAGGDFEQSVELRSSDDRAKSRFHDSRESGDAPHVLLAEDNPVNQRVATLMLEHLGCQVTLAASGAEALERLERESFDLVFMDCQMPGVDGLEATRRIRALAKLSRRGGRLPIVALTAHAHEEDRQRCLAAGMDDFLSKPFTREDLARCAANWVVIERESDPKVPAAQRRDARPVIDTGILEQLRSLDAKGAGLLERVIQAFLGSAPKLMRQIDEAVVAGDATAAGDAAHALKSSSGQLGARRVSELARLVEDRARQGSVEGSEELVDQLGSELRDASKSLRALLRPPTPAPQS